jgi:hypothetical protein
MNPTTQTINTSEDFDAWWRDTGQFLQPCDTADEEMREQFRLYASKMFKEREDAIEEVRGVIFKNKS